MQASRWRRGERVAILVILVFLPTLSGCNQGSESTSKFASGNSANHYLLAADLDKFQVGRSKAELLEDLQWRGEFLMTSEHQGQSVTVIMYDVMPLHVERTSGVSAWAVFVDNKFAKFVDHQRLLPEDKVYVRPNDGRPKPLKAGDDRYLVRAINDDPLSKEDLIREVGLLGPHLKVKADWGLIAVYWITTGFGLLDLLDRESASPTTSDYERNAELRDQFNAARLDLGMTQAEIETILKATAIESGEVEAGSYRIYGSHEAFNITAWVHFNNVLVIFREDEAVSIDDMNAGYRWRKELAERIIDLPVPPASRE